MKAEIITIGTELLQGDIADTNSLYLAEELARLGVDLLYKTTVGDDEKNIEESLRVALRRSQMIITTGGLGPTEDDITKKILSRTLGRRLIFREDLRDRIAARHARLHKEMPRHLETQAVVPHGSQVVDNPVGTAPGLILEHEKGVIIALPGVPHEMSAMFRETVFEFIRKAAGGYGAIRLRVLRTFGLMEPQVNDLIVDMMGTGKEPYIGLTAKETGVDVRINAFGRDEAGASRLIQSSENRIRSCLGSAVYGVDRQTMEEVVGGLLRERGLHISVAESCTGGLIGNRLTNVPGSSDYFEGGMICYSNRLKEELLQVPPEGMQRHGAVSAWTAKAMADGLRQVSRTDLSVAVTGIAGPDGGTPEKPVGTVYIALATPKGTDCEEHRLTGTREVIKLKTSQHALNRVRQFLLRE